MYWARDPATGAMRRVREKLNHVRDRRQREAYAAMRVHEIGMLLRSGWNPFRDRLAKHAGMPLEEALAKFLAAKERAKLSRHSMRSYRSYCSILEQWLRKNDAEGKAAGAFDMASAKAFLQDCALERNLSPRAYNNYVQFYVSLWNWLVEMGAVATNVFTGIKRMRRDPDRTTTRRPPNQEERARIRGYLAMHPRFNAFCMLVFHCGIRPNEVFQLKPEHFHLAAQAITVPGTISKNRRTQGVAIPNPLLPLLLGLNMDRQRPDHYVFSTGFRPGARQLSSRESGKAWGRLREATGLAPEVTLYQLKHAGARQLSRDGVEAVDLMNHLRHHDLHETSIYTRGSFDAGVRSVIEKASEF